MNCARRLSGQGRPSTGMGRAGSTCLMQLRWNGWGGVSCRDQREIGRGKGDVPSGFDGIVMESAGFRFGRSEVETKKPSKIEGLGERETGFEPATFSLGRGVNQPETERAKLRNHRLLTRNLSLPAPQRPVPSRWNRPLPWLHPHPRSYSFVAKIAPISSLRWAALRTIRSTLATALEEIVVVRP